MGSFPSDWRDRNGERISIISRRLFGWEADIVWIADGDRPAVVEFLAFCAMAERISAAGPALGALPADETHYESGDSAHEEVLHNVQGLGLLGAWCGFAPQARIVLRRELMLNE
jgi:hypothetical protein